jgi:hypothetical protein
MKVIFMSKATLSSLKLVLYLIRTAMKNLSSLVVIVLVAVVFGQIRGFEYGMRGDILKTYLSTKGGRISSGEPNDLI